MGLSRTRSRAFFAIIDAAISLEVLLKALLVREYWSLIVANVVQASEVGLVRGEAVTVSRQTVIRLQEITHLRPSRWRSRRPDQANDQAAESGRRLHPGRLGEHRRARVPWREFPMRHPAEVRR